MELSLKHLGKHIIPAETRRVARFVRETKNVQILIWRHRRYNKRIQQ